MGNSKGSALVIVLALTLVLFLGCLFLVKVAKESIYAAQCLMDKLEAQMKAESAVEEFKFFGSTGKFSFNTLIPQTGERNKPSSEIPLDDTPIEIEKGVQLKVLDAGAKMNAWGLDANALEKLLAQSGVDKSKARVVRDSILDWFDEDDLKRLNGAESSYYGRETRAEFHPRNAPAIQSIQELYLIKGLDDPDTWSKIEGDLILSPGTRPNINTMDRRLLTSVLGVPDTVADQLLKLRREKGHLSYTDVSSTTGLDFGVLMETLNLSTYSTRVVSLTVEALHGEAREVLHCNLTFQPDKLAPYRVLEFTY